MIPAAGRSLLRCVIAAFIAQLAACMPTKAPLPPIPGVAPGRVIEMVNGHWFDGVRFVDRTMYSVGGIFSAKPGMRVDSVIDLQGGYVVPPFAEAHNHNIDASTPATASAVVAKYMRDGVFYGQNPCDVLRGRRGLSGFINVPTGVDATFSNGCLTGPGGHPLGLYLRNLARGGMLPADSNSTDGFVWTIADQDDLARKWPRILASHPDFIKTLLLYSEEYESRKADTVFFNWRGLNPALLPEIVRRAHAAGLRVMTHIETAADFHNALAAGVDEIGHMPGFRGNEKMKLPSLTPYLIPDADAELAAHRGVFIVTTLGEAATISPTGPDSIVRRRLDSLATLNLRTLRKHRARIAIGSDSYRNTSVPEALYLSSLGIFSNAELLRLWTEETALAIFPKRRIGRLAPGYEASLLVLDGDPLADFSNIKRIRLRMKQGELIQMGPAQSRGPTRSAEPLDLAARIDRYLEPYLAGNNFTGVIRVSRPGKVLFERGYGMANYELQVPNTPKSRFHIASATKTFTSAAILLLEERGLLSDSDSVAKFIPDYPRGPQIRIEHLLRHTSGIPNYSDLPDYGREERFPHTLAEIVAMFKQKPFDFEPGSKQRYSNSNYILLAFIIEKVSGQSYADFLRTNIFERLGLDATLHDGLASRLIANRATGTEPDGVKGVRLPRPIDWSNNTGAASLVTTAEDIDRFVRAIFEGNLLTRGSVAKILQPLPGFSYGWARDERFGRKQIKTGGRSPGFNVSVERYLDDSTNVIVLSNSYSPVAQDSAFLNDLHSIVFGKDVTAPKVRPVLLAPGVFAGAAGGYEMPSNYFVPNAKIRLVDRGGYYDAIWSDGTVNAIYPVSLDELLDRGYWARVKFSRDSVGRINGFAYTLIRTFQARRIDSR